MAFNAECPDEVVQGGPQAVHDVGNPEAHLLDWRLPVDACRQDNLARPCVRATDFQRVDLRGRPRFQITLTRDLVRATPNEAAKQTIERFEVHIRPTNPGDTRFVGGYRSRSLTHGVTSP